MMKSHGSGSRDSSRSINLEGQSLNAPRSNSNNAVDETRDFLRKKSRVESNQERLKSESIEKKLTEEETG
jgi:hypothetical protein